MATSKKKKNKNNSGQALALFVFVIIFVIILISSVFGDWVQIMDNRNQTEELNKKYDMLLEEEASLNSEVIKLQDPLYVERYAREKFMYTKEGELILKMIDNDLVIDSKKEEDEENE